MRSAPLGIWGWRLDEADLVTAAMDDSRLTHPNLTCRHASALYCLAIRHLVRNASGMPKSSSGSTWPNGMWMSDTIRNPVS